MTRNNIKFFNLKLFCARLMIAALAILPYSSAKTCGLTKPLLLQLEKEYALNGYRKELYSPIVNFPDLKTKIGGAGARITYEDPFFYHF
ncbi:MAG: hypothetical protein LBP41_02350 [Holosporaceae bacterium]|jgi:hypothetical protein|nr:hypothetical protein [Holosporaceae bacterium]